MNDAAKAFRKCLCWGLAAAGLTLVAFGVGAEEIQDNVTSQESFPLPYTVSLDVTVNRAGREECIVAVIEKSLSSIFREVIVSSNTADSHPVALRFLVNLREHSFKDKLDNTFIVKNNVGALLAMEAFLSDTHQSCAQMTKRRFVGHEL